MFGILCQQHPDEWTDTAPLCPMCKKPMSLVTIRTGPRCKDVRAQYWECRSYHKQ